MKTLAIGNDHRGIQLKKYLAELLSDHYTVLDCGTNTSKSKKDYPDFAKKVTKLVGSGKAHMGILICNTGIGMSIAANRIKGIRAALCYTPEHARLARLHNNANILVLGAEFISKEDALSCVNTFLGNEFEKGRHEKRLQKIDAL
jgi:ribose 5-phosphate isomerase B